MAADTATSRSEAPLCPDPSAHEHHNKLSAQASTAALYVTNPPKGNHSRNSSIQSESILGPDGKLSSKSAATSLKYAKAQDLPSFPSSGNASGSAGKAAMLAKDYKMKELWQPEQSAAGSKAAILAANRGAKLDLWQASATAEGQSAATLAFRNKGLSPQAYGGNNAEAKSKALMAATGATQQSRARALSTPQPPPELYPDQANASRNALNAASVSHRQSRGDGWDSEANQSARVTHLGDNVSGKMFTGNPDWQYEEDKHKSALRASTITMAKSLYANQNRDNMLLEPDGSDLSAARSATRNQAVAKPDIKQEALQYISLQDTAHRLAAERLAKIDKDMEGKRFREHYGYGDKPSKTLSSRMSKRASGTERRGRQRASSDGTRGRYDSESDSDDERQAGRIRAQMAGLNTATRQVDARKQQNDRAKLLAEAEKRVSARMQDMDSQVYRDTGKVSPAMIEEWEAKAREKADRQRQERALNPGKTHIGGGQFMDQSEIEAIAAARLKPTLDEISATAASRRQHDEDMRIEKDKQQTAKMEEKMAKQQEKDQQKAIKNDLRESSKREKAEEKARKDEEKRASQLEQRKSRDVKRDTTGSSILPMRGTETGKTDEAPGGLTESAPVSDGRDKHQSALARLKAKFRTTGSHEKTVETEPVASAADKPAHTGTTIAGGVATGAVTGATLAELDKKDAPTQPLDAQQASHAVAEDTGAPTTSAPATTIGGAQQTTYKTEPAVSPLAESQAQIGTTAAAPVVPIAHADSDSDADGEESLYDDGGRSSTPMLTQSGSVSGLANDSIPTVSHGDRMTTLEKHISNIPDSEGSSLSSDNEDWNEERPPISRGTVPDQEPSVVALAPGPISPAVAKHESASTSAEPWFPPSAVAGIGGASEIAPAPVISKQTAPQPMTDVPARTETPGVPRDTSAPDTASLVAIPPASVTSSPVAPSRELSKNPKGEEDLPAAVDVPAQSTSTSRLSSSAPETSKKAAEKAGQPTSSARRESKNENDRGVRGFFSKLRNKPPRSENSPGTITSGSISKYDDSNHEIKAGEKPTIGGAKALGNEGSYDKSATDAAVKQTLASAAPVTTTNTSTIPPVDTGAAFSPTTVQHQHSTDDGAIGDSTKAVDTAEPTSPTSFIRGTTTSTHPDDVSSSGADEDDVQRGRTGGRSFSKKLGFGRNRDAHVKDGKLHKPAPGTEGMTSTDLRRSEDDDNDNDNDNFEEARDHFDESLAPPPAFTQKKSESPVRETRFKEDV